MKKLLLVASAISLSLGVAACGESADTEEVAAAGLTGDWQINLDSASWENDVSTYVLADGQYTCETCIPPYSVAADGEWHDVDRPGSDSQMVEIVDDRTVRMASRRDGEDLGSSTYTISEDGQSATIEFTDLDGEEPVEGSATLVRVADGPEGAHAMSGGWTVGGISDMSDSGLTFSYAVDGDQFTSTGNGTSFTATLGGEAVAIEGSAAGVMVAVESLDGGGYRETYTLDGEVTSVTDLTVDGDTLSGVSNDPRDGSSVSWTASRQ